MPAGRPPIWSDPEAFEKKVDEYFNTEAQPTWSGLALYMGFESRKSLHEYGTKEEFSYPVKKALIRIEQMYEQNLVKQNAAGSIFALKNFGWKDQSEIKHDIPRAFINIDPLADDNSTDNSPKEDITP